MQALEYETAEKVDLSEFYETTLHKIQNDSVKKLLAEVMQKRETGNKN